MDKEFSLIVTVTLFVLLMFVSGFNVAYGIGRDHGMKIGAAETASLFLKGSLN